MLSEMASSGPSTETCEATTTWIDKRKTNEQVSGTQLVLLGQLIGTHLESAHIPWVAGILETVLIALEEEFQEEPEIGAEGRVKQISFVIYSFPGLFSCCDK